VRGTQSRCPSVFFPVYWRDGLSLPLLLRCNCWPYNFCWPHIDQMFRVPSFIEVFPRLAVHFLRFLVSRKLVSGARIINNISSFYPCAWVVGVPFPFGGFPFSCSRGGLLQRPSSQPPQRPFAWFLNGLFLRILWRSLTFLPLPMYPPPVHCLSHYGTPILVFCYVCNDWHLSADLFFPPSPPQWES